MCMKYSDYPSWRFIGTWLIFGSTRTLVLQYSTMAGTNGASVASTVFFFFQTHLPESPWAKSPRNLDFLTFHIIESIRSSSRWKWTATMPWAKSRSSTCWLSRLRDSRSRWTKYGLRCKECRKWGNQRRIPADTA